MKTQDKRLFLVYSLSTVSNEPTIRKGKPLFYSSLKEAEAVVSQFRDLFTHLYDVETQGEHVYCLVIEEFEMDTPFRNQLATRVYSPDGILIGDCMVPDSGPFLGRSPSSIHHEVGDVIEFICGDKLVFGMVVEKPIPFNEEARGYGLTASDDCYSVIHHPSRELDYAHAPMVFKPSREVSGEIRADLMSAFNQMDIK